MNLYDLALVLSVLEGIAVDQRTNFLSVIGVLASNQNNWLHIVQIIIAAILPQHSLSMLMQGQTVADFHFLYIFLAVSGCVGTSGNNRNFQIPFRSAPCDVISINDA